MSSGYALWTAVLLCEKVLGVVWAKEIKIKIYTKPQKSQYSKENISSCGVSEQATDEFQGAADLTNQTRAQTVHCLLNNGKEKQKEITWKKEREEQSHWWIIRFWPESASLNPFLWGNTKWVLPASITNALHWGFKLS